MNFWLQTSSWLFSMSHRFVVNWTKECMEKCFLSLFILIILKSLSTSQSSSKSHESFLDNGIEHCSFFLLRIRGLLLHHGLWILCDISVISSYCPWRSASGISCRSNKHISDKSLAAEGMVLRTYSNVIFQVLTIELDRPALRRNCGISSSKALTSVSSLFRSCCR